MSLYASASFKNRSSEITPEVLAADQQTLEDYLALLENIQNSLEKVWEVKRVMRWFQMMLPVEIDQAKKMIENFKMMQEGITFNPEQSE